MDRVTNLPMDMDIGNHSGWTPLMYASYHGHPRLVVFLINQNADVHTVNNKGRLEITLDTL